MSNVLVPQHAEAVFARLVDVYSHTDEIRGYAPLVLDSCRFTGYSQAAHCTDIGLQAIKLRLQVGRVLSAVAEASFSNTSKPSEIFSNARHVLGNSRRDGLDRFDDFVLSVMECSFLEPTTVTLPGEIRNLFLSLENALAAISTSFLKVEELNRAFIITDNNSWQDTQGAILLKQAGSGLFEAVSNALGAATKQGRLWTLEKWRNPEIDIRLAIHGYPAMASRLPTFVCATDYPHFVREKWGLRPVAKIPSSDWKSQYSLLEATVADAAA